jgi:RNA-directed DNA polymerase
MLEEILDRRNIERALESVEANKGSSGIDSMPWNILLPYINANWQQLRKSILEECYKPKPVREVEIDKSSGGKRKLGIPTVVDRMLTQAIAQWLMPKYEENFSNRSYGFRPNRNAHQAILQAQSYLNV